MPSTRRRAIALALPFALLVAACGGGGASSAPSAAASDAPSAAPSEAASAEAPSAGVSEVPASAAVALADNELGTILVDGAGMTLYGFTADTEGISTCYDDCEASWPPLLDDAGTTAGEGLDAALLTTVPRTDGTTQLKYGDWPLYYWAADAAPGDATGQGVGGVWFVIGADGALIGQ